MEEYRVIQNFNNYEISNKGNVRNKNTGKLLKQHVYGNGGYKMVSLTQDKVKLTKWIHRLVGETFISNPDNKPCIDHKDNNRTNNHIDNLRWATKRENVINSKISSKNSSGYKGVSYDKKNNKWKARININGVNTFLGYYVEKNDAIEARKLKANMTLGEYINKCEKEEIIENENREDKRSKNNKNTSGCVGVSFNKINNKWRARINIDGKNVHLGFFENKIDAIEARKTKDKSNV